MPSERVHFVSTTYERPEWGDGLGLGRTKIDGSATVILRRDGSPTAHVAHVAGQTFSDLPALLAACSGDLHLIRQGTSVVVPDDELLAPTANPGKIICVGLNYSAHAQEAARPAAGYPALFAKWPTSLAPPYADIPLPPESPEVDFEAELVAVIGKRIRRATASDAGAAIFGYTVANDGSVRDYQRHTTQVTAGKAWDGMTPIGPVVVPASLLGQEQPDLRISGTLDGRLQQEDRTSRMDFSVGALIEYITEFLTLEPGDLILTGTPAGVGFVRQPPVFLTAGCEFEVRIEGIGTIRNSYYLESDAGAGA